MRTLFTLLISMILFQSCQDGKTTRPALNTMAAYTLPDVSYGPDSLQRMDVYLPAGRSAATTKAMILVHGGGWTGGNKRDFAAYIDAFRKRMPDYAFFNLNYRLVGGAVLLPQQEEDIRAAVNGIVSKAGEYGINPQKLVLLGASAGAHLALLQAYKQPAPKFAAVVDFFGPTDLQAMHDSPWHPLVPIALQMITGTKPSLQPAAYRNASPVSFVTAAVPPTLIFHGGKDNVVDVSQSRALADTLKGAGVPHELVIYPGERHGWQGANLKKSFDKLEDFLEKHVP
ncbi:MAG: alpha/beta hydrolase [Chitinophagaceae bacterium]|nr:MAG: alpha/beta hydrolase [Chitinophagaceae bacterium]